ncbi:MAG: GNAT family N-acetyltransferase [Paludibacteraceae bacterium]|nr:GNAT family N-acetyltransferase [Paludibacteraceae bacterium]
MIIRKALIKDVDPIAGCMVLAMEDIVYQFMGIKDQEQAVNLLKYFIVQKHNQYSYENCWVMEDDDEVVAAVNVYDGALLEELRTPVREYIQTKFSKEFSPEDETSVGEYYIDTLGVNPDRQGKGIGSKLLTFLIEKYVNKRGETLGLLVDVANPTAKQLYLKLGFKVVGKQMLVGESMEHLQYNIVTGS